MSNPQFWEYAKAKAVSTLLYKKKEKIEPHLSFLAFLFFSWKQGYDSQWSAASLSS